MDSSGSFRPGQLVWSKMPGFPPYWPSIICEEDGSMPPSIRGHKIQVFFLGVHEFNYVFKSEIIPHSQKYFEEAKLKNRNLDTWHTALKEAGDSVLQVKLWKEYAEKFHLQKKAKKVMKSKNQKKKTKKTNKKLKEKIENKKLICKISLTQTGLRIPSSSQSADPSHIDAASICQVDSQSSFGNDVASASTVAASPFSSEVVGASSNDTESSFTSEVVSDSSNDAESPFSSDVVSASSNAAASSSHVIVPEIIVSSFDMEDAGSANVELAGPSTMECEGLSEYQAAGSSTGLISVESANSSALPVYKKIYRSMLSAGKASLGYLPPGVVSLCSLPSKGTKMIMKCLTKLKRG
ncbi:hypothetical protein JTE90_015994 [Oedothorax gibbosus]|uniref:PWWP domain-containing protein n=1 Tax=Oedothorax gibbosus TaxID=931172 RepID=A0AAV6VSV8_9ARAC|nr:hypothetical protein JTE90_015994 [Oedothorax gibbosus]